VAGKAKAEQDWAWSEKKRKMRACLPFDALSKGRRFSPRFLRLLGKCLVVCFLQCIGRHCPVNKNANHSTNIDEEIRLLYCSGLKRNII
jgi:hypothetical protein